MSKSNCCDYYFLFTLKGCQDKLARIATFIYLHVKVRWLGYYSICLGQRDRVAIIIYLMKPCQSQTFRTAISFTSLGNRKDRGLELPF